jgi:regulator of sirC expression with transglutaminase-like and TPR domain
LFEEEGFFGNVDEYYNPENSYLHRVLERRTGIPVSLSVIYLLIARRLRLPMHGISMPVHFICKYQTSHESFFFDPFHAGRIITRAECIKLLHGSGQRFEDGFLEPASPRRIVGRMVRNLFLIYYQNEHSEKATLLDRILKLLRIPE